MVKSIKDIIISNKLFFLLAVLFFLIGAFLLLSTEKGSLELQLNANHNKMLDVYFQVTTYFGDGLLAIAFIVSVILFLNIYKGVLFGISVGVSSLVAQLLKHFAYPDELRPMKFFENIKNIYYIDGLDVHSYYSFPSGHTTQAFSIFMLCAILIADKRWGAVCFIAALSTAISRIYLMQHFIKDVYFGALLGVTITLVIYVLIEKYSNWKQHHQLQKSLLGIWSDR